jgi:hypothetical protein
MIIGMYLMKNNVEMLLDNMMLIVDDLFQNTMIVQMDRESIQDYLRKHQYTKTVFFRSYKFILTE